MNKPTILIVDHNDTHSRLIRDNICDADKIIEAKSVEDALKEIRKFRKQATIDEESEKKINEFQRLLIVLTEFAIPKKSGESGSEPVGINFIKKLYECEIPTILVTYNRRKDVTEIAKQYSVLNVPKPLEVKKLRRAVRTVLRLSKEKNDAAKYPRFLSRFLPKRRKIKKR